MRQSYIFLHITKTEEIYLIGNALFGCGHIDWSHMIAMITPQEKNNGWLTTKPQVNKVLRISPIKHQN